MSEEAKIEHDSDCALHNGPAYEPGPCNCGASLPAPQEQTED